MIGNFEVEIEGTRFEFHTMNVQRLQLFQVYVNFEGKKRRFHMQRNAEGDFILRIRISASALLAIGTTV